MKILKNFKFIEKNQRIRMFVDKFWALLWCKINGLDMFSIVDFFFLEMYGLLYVVD